MLAYYSICWLPDPKPTIRAHDVVHGLTSAVVLQDFGILRPGRLQTSGPSFAMQLSQEDLRPMSAPAAPALPLIRPEESPAGPAELEAEAFNLQPFSTPNSQAEDWQVMSCNFAIM